MKPLNLERAVIEVFGGCNYSCPMCPQSGEGRGSNWTRMLPLKTFIKILDEITPKYGKPVINLEGSGEATLNKYLPQYIQECTNRGLQSFMYTNGSRFTGKLMRDAIDAGLSFVRFSCIGYNQELYKEWMSKDNFELLKRNVKETQDYIKESGSNCEVSSYHLIIDNDNIDYEVEQYRKSFIDELGTIGYIWKMHNWSGNYDPSYGRTGQVKKTCGRPFAPEITVRAGGLDGKHAAVTPCCQTMGPPNEDKSVLGHLDESSLEDVYWGEKYEELRKLHKEERFDEIDYCKNCDFLITEPEVLVWSNDPEAKINRMLGTKFSLEEYQK